MSEGIEEVKEDSGEAETLEPTSEVKPKTKAKRKAKAKPKAETPKEAYQEANKARGRSGISKKVAEMLKDQGVIFVQANPNNAFQVLYDGSQQVKIINLHDADKNLIEPVVESKLILDAMDGKDSKLSRLDTEAGLEAYNSTGQRALRDKLSDNALKRHNNHKRLEAKARAKAEAEAEREFEDA